jgi:hypothetical protein
MRSECSFQNIVPTAGRGWRSLKQVCLQAVIQATTAQTATLQALDNRQAQEVTVALGPCRLVCFIASAPNYGQSTRELPTKW